MSHYTNKSARHQYKVNRQRQEAAFKRRWFTGKASEYIKRASDELKPGARVFLYIRVSGRAQEWNKNADDQEAHLWQRQNGLALLL